MAVDEDGRVFITDVGQGGWEEINTGGPGANSGWPFYEGVDGGGLGETPGYNGLSEAGGFYEAVESGEVVVIAPYRAFSHASEDPDFRLESIVSGSVIYDGGQYPAEFADDLFFGDFLDGNLFAIDTAASDELRYLGELPGLIHLEQGPDGFLYASNIYNGTIARLTITPIAAPVQAVIAIGDAEAVEGSEGEFLLTPAATFAVGGAVGTTRIDLGQDGRFVFELDLGDVDAEGADGAAFILHNDPAGRTALGDAGEFLGIVGLSDAVAIEFDTYDNGDADPEADHASILATDDPGFAGTNGAVELSNIEDGGWHRVEVIWDASSETLSYRFDGVLRDSRTGAITQALGDSPFAYFAVTAATGGFLTEHRVRLIAADVTYADVVEDQAPVIFGGASRLLEVEESTDGPVLEPEATDAEGGPITWSIAGGPDAGRFSVDAGTGALSFRAAPDFEAPADSDGDNLYRLTLRAADAGGLASTQTVEIRVTDRTGEGGTGGPGPERLNGTSGADELTGGGGADTIYGAAGADTILATVGDGSDMIYGGVGPGDTYSLAGTTANAVASVGLPRSSSAETGADTLNGIENLTGGGGSDRLSGNNNGNVLRGGGGNDTLVGAGGNDTLEGDEAADLLDGGTGNDRMAGGAGNDTYLVREAGDLVIEEADGGIDLVISARPYSLTAEADWLDLTGTVRDGNGNDLANRIRGQDAANRLLGRDGADTLIGNGGADTLNGGAGGDRIEGGSGADIIFIASASQGGDRLVDYAGLEDALHVSAAGFGGGLFAGMDLVAEWRIISRADGLSTAPEGTAQFIFESDARQLRWDIDGSGDAAAVLIADFSTARNWSASEVVVVA